MEKWKENSGSKRNAEGIVQQREEQIHLDSTENGSTQIQCCTDVLDIAFHKYQIRCLGSNFSSCSNADAYICLGESWRIVDPISNHSDNLILLLQSRHLLYLCNGQCLGNDPVGRKPQLVRDGSCGATIVPSNHPDI